MIAEKRKTKKTTTSTKPISGISKTTIEWGLYKKQNQNYISSSEENCLLSGRTFESNNPVQALEDAFSSIAQIVTELNLDRGTEVRVSVRKN